MFRMASKARGNLEHLGPAASLLARYSKFIQLKEGCSNRWIDEEGNSRCRRAKSNGGMCLFEECQLVRGADCE